MAPAFPANSTHLSLALAAPAGLESLRAESYSWRPSRLAPSGFVSCKGGERRVSNPTNNAVLINFLLSSDAEFFC